MNGEKELRKRLYKGKGMEIVALVFLAVSALCLLMLVMTGRDDKSTALDLANNFENTNQYSYIDVVKLEDWVCKYDDRTYYTAFDGNNYIYSVVLKESEYKKLVKDHPADENDTSHFDTPIRLYGVTKNVENKVKEMYQEVYKIDASDFDYYFGHLYLDTTTTPAVNDRWMWFTFAFISALIALVFWLIGADGKKTLNRSLAALSDTELQEAADELIAIDSREKALFGEKYFFSKKAPFVAKYSDITWMYPHRVRTNGIVTNKSVVVNTRACSDMNWQVKDLEGSYEKIAEVVRQVNPEVMLGYTEENKQMYQNTL